MSDRRRRERGSGHKQAYVLYSRQDSEAAQQVAQTLRAYGVEVWLDAESLSGDDWQSQLIRGIQDSDIVVLLWSENAAKSSYFQRELQIAHRYQKPLAPVLLDKTPLTAEVEYFVANLQHFDLSGIPQLAASIARTDNLVEEQRRAQSTRKVDVETERRTKRTAGLSRLRISAGYWIGIISAVITLAGNLEKIIQIARMIRGLLGVWADILISIWRTVIPFRIHIVAEDAIILTFMTVMFFNLIVTSRERDISIRTRSLDYVFLISGLAGVGYLSFLGFLDKAVASDGGIVAILTAPILAQAHAVVPSSLDAAVGFLTMMLAAVIVIAVLYAPVALIMNIRPNINAFSVRLWRILGGVLVLVILNFLALWIERQPWAAGTVLGG